MDVDKPGTQLVEHAQVCEVADEAFGLLPDLVPDGVELPTDEGVKAAEQCVLDREVLNVKLSATITAE